MTTVKAIEKTTGSLWNYYRDKPRNRLSSNSESFKYRTSIVGKTLKDDDSLTNTKVFIPLKRLGSFWRALNIPLINCAVELILTWSKNCVLADMTTKDAGGNNPAIVAPLGATFERHKTVCSSCYFVKRK